MVMESISVNKYPAYCPVCECASALEYPVMIGSQLGCKLCLTTWTPAKLSEIYWQMQLVKPVHSKRNDCVEVIEIELQKILSINEIAVYINQELTKEK